MSDPLFRHVLYALKRRFGKTITLKLVSQGAFDRTTGQVTKNVDEVDVRRAVVLTEETYRLYGPQTFGEFDQSNRYIILERTVNVREKDLLCINGRDWQIAKIEKDDDAFYVKATAVDDES